jgi:hypothetical protein
MRPPPMKETSSPLLLLALAILGLQLPLGFGQGTMFTYQGRLNDGSNPANGSYDLSFTLFDSDTNGNQLGPVLTNTATAVSNGLFLVGLDFGNQFPGANRWLEIAVTTNSVASFVTLIPRQQIPATPYAITAGNVMAGGIPAGLYTNAVIFNNANNAFAGNGAGITNLALSSFSGAAQTQLNNLASAAARPAVSGLIEWNDPSSVAATNGHALSVFPDVSGNGNHLYNATANSVLYGAINGAPAINLPANWGADGSSPTLGYGLSNAVWTAAMNTNFTLTLVFKDVIEKGGSNDNPPLLDGGQQLMLFEVGTNLTFFACPMDARIIYPYIGVELNNGIAPAFPLHGNHEPFVFTVRLKAGVVDAWLNGIQVLDRQAAGYHPTTALGNLFLLGTMIDGNVLRADLGSVNGLYGDIVLSTNGESDSELYALHSYLMRKYSIGGGVQLVLEGDSIMLGAYSGIKSNFTALVQSAFPIANVVCEASSGKLSGQLLSYETNWVPMQVPGTSQRIAVVMYGANDLNNNVGIGDYCSNWSSTLSLLRANNYRVVGCTMPSNNREIGYASTRAQMNNYLYTNATAFDAIADFAADEFMGYAGAYTNEIYFIDQLHPTGVGYVELFDKWLCPALAKLIGGSTAANLPGITTNVSASGITFYITNGLIMRITSP